MNVEFYARRFLNGRGYRLGRDFDQESCVSKAAEVLIEEQGMQMTLANLRSWCAMAQFSKRELPAHVLKLVEESGDISGDAVVSIDSTSAQIVSEGKAQA